MFKQRNSLQCNSTLPCALERIVPAATLTTDNYSGASDCASTSNDAVVKCSALVYYITECNLTALLLVFVALCSVEQTGNWHRMHYNVWVFSRQFLRVVLAQLMLMLSSLIYSWESCMPSISVAQRQCTNKQSTNFCWSKIESTSCSNFLHVPFLMSLEHRAHLQKHGVRLGQ